MKSLLQCLKFSWKAVVLVFGPQGVLLSRRNCFQQLASKLLHSDSVVRKLWKCRLFFSFNRSICLTISGMISVKTVKRKKETKPLVPPHSTNLAARKYWKWRRLICQFHSNQLNGRFIWLCNKVAISGHANEFDAADKQWKLKKEGARQ